ncbi:hypothetical protein C0Z01_06170 [Photobacterium kishitanii]|uniref:hypothetical protein n=1 Tax=Photobacterium kishitanii TaxID=318456 RepID=UPI0007F030A6|nr:hypothetical protein [Photobacterium kishitanii]OBU26654.1 hypothetical protein AYY22_17650 [Photobacterium kishitanii]PSW70396.1 hypothetical protein C0Z01_06170 [Photobacterium kishitanii]
MEAQTVISFLVGLIGAGIGAYVVSYFKISAQITAETNHIKEKLEQIYLKKNQEESAKIDAVTNKIDEILEQQRAITSTNEAAKIDVLTAKMDQVVEQQKNITTTTETIKSNVDIDNWRKKENQILRRDKIELLYTKITQSSKIRRDFIYGQHTLNEERKNEIHEDVANISFEIAKIIALYFGKEEELVKHVNEFIDVQKITLRAMNKNDLNIKNNLDFFENLDDSYLKATTQMKEYIINLMKEELED